MSRLKPWIMPENARLNRTQQARNAGIIYSYFTSEGWGKAAICGMLGNMQVESYINPRYWEGGTPGNIDTSSRGYGLTQWTPARKLLDRANEKYPDQPKEKYTWPETQLGIILDESSRPDRPVYQWDSSLNPWRMTFSTWTMLDAEQDLDMATEAFCLSYEMPDIPNIELRQEYARYWWDNVKPAQEKLPIWLLIDKRRRVRK